MTWLDRPLQQVRWYVVLLVYRSLLGIKTTINLPSPKAFGRIEDMHSKNMFMKVPTKSELPSRPKMDQLFVLLQH